MIQEPFQNMFLSDKSMSFRHPDTLQTGITENEQDVELKLGQFESKNDQKSVFPTL